MLQTDAEIGSKTEGGHKSRKPERYAEKAVSWMISFASAALVSLTVLMSTDGYISGCHTASWLQRGTVVQWYMAKKI